MPCTGCVPSSCGGICPCFSRPWRWPPPWRHPLERRDAGHPLGGGRGAQPGFPHLGAVAAGAALRWSPCSPAAAFPGPPGTGGPSPARPPGPCAPPSPPPGLCKFGGGGLMPSGPAPCARSGGRGHCGVLCSLSPAGPVEEGREPLMGPGRSPDTSFIFPFHFLRFTLSGALPRPSVLRRRGPARHYALSGPAPTGGVRTTDGASQVSPEGEFLSEPPERNKGRLRG